MLEKIGGFMCEIGLIVRASHERWDGTGYPDGLRGDAIPLEARIVSACDAFNAMVTTRSYRKAIPVPDAVAELERCAGSQFDPRVIEGLLHAIDATVRAPRLQLRHEGPLEGALDDAPLEQRPRTAALTVAPTGPGRPKFRFPRAAEGTELPRP